MDITDLKYKRIVIYTEEELDFAIEHTKVYCIEKGFDFFTILRGVDAYFERRKRRGAL